MIPPEQDAYFVAKMEDVLSIYRRPYDPNRPVICMDEMPRQLVEEVRKPLPMETGKPKGHNYHYQRNGVVNLFMFFDPDSCRDRNSLYSRTPILSAGLLEPHTALLIFTNGPLHAIYVL